jgi:hypothetical protein
MFAALVSNSSFLVNKNMCTDSFMLGFIPNVKQKAKPILVTGRGPGCEMSGIPHFLVNRLTDGGEVVSLRHRPRFTRQKDFLIISVRG